MRDARYHIIAPASEQNFSTTVSVTSAYQSIGANFVSGWDLRRYEVLDRQGLCMVVVVLGGDTTDTLLHVYEVPFHN